MGKSAVCNRRLVKAEPFICCTGAPAMTDINSDWSCHRRLPVRKISEQSGSDSTETITTKGAAKARASSNWEASITLPMPSDLYARRY